MKYVCLFVTLGCSQCLLWLWVYLYEDLLMSRSTHRCNVCCFFLHYAIQLCQIISSHITRLNCSKGQIRIRNPVKVNICYMASSACNRKKNIKILNLLNNKNLFSGNSHQPLFSPLKINWNQG